MCSRLGVCIPRERGVASLSAFSLSFRYLVRPSVFVTALKMSQPVWNEFALRQEGYKSRRPVATREPVRSHKAGAPGVTVEPGGTYSNSSIGVHTVMVLWQLLSASPIRRASRCVRRASNTHIQSLPRAVLHVLWPGERRCITDVRLYDVRDLCVRK